MKTSDLTGTTLDWAVAKCEGVAFDIAPDGYYTYKPSTNWLYGGPIIERERICLTRPRWDGEWTALLVYEDRSFDGVASVEFDAPTPLIAAMRCFVASRLGDEVEVPEKLKGVYVHST